MKIIIFPDRIYKDSRANAPFPLDHSNAANWANVIVYSIDNLFRKFWRAW